MQLDALQNPFGESPLIGILGTPAANPDGLSIAGFVESPVALGADTALTPNLDVINAPIAFTPEDTNVAATLPDLTVPPVQVASTEGSIGTGDKLPSLQQFKDSATKLANDPNLKPEERQTWRDFKSVADQLSPEDFGKLTLNEQFTTPGKVADGSTGDKVGDLTPKAQNAIRTANPTNYYRPNNGVNFNGILTTAGSGVVQALIRLGSIFGERAILNPNQQIYTLVQRVGVPVSVAVPITLKYGVKVPVTVVSTLPGGVVTRILVYRPNPVTTTPDASKPTSTAKPVVVAAKPTETPKPNSAKVKRDAEESSHADLPKEVQGDPEHDVIVPPVNWDPEYYVEPEPKEWENTYGKEVVINPVEVPGHGKETDKPQWDNIDTTFKYQAGDYGPWEYARPPSGKSDEPSYPKEEWSHPKGSGGGAVDKEKQTP